MSPRRLSGQSKQRGAVLFVALILLVVLTLIGLTAARMQTAEEGIARNEQNHQLALQYAEAALRNAEGALGQYQQSQYMANANGLYQLSLELQTGAQASIADTINWATAGAQAITYSGPSLGNAPAPPQPAQILIEAMPPVTPVGSQMGDPRYGAQQTQIFPYRVTAHAAGGDSSSSATLQSVTE